MATLTAAGQHLSKIPAPTASSPSGDHVDEQNSPIAASPDVSAGKSLTIAYILWLVGGALGLHHVYLRRDRHAFAMIATCGGFGFGWLHDGVKLGGYVRECNELPSRKLSRRRKMAQVHATPSNSSARHMGSLLLGYMCAAGYLAMLPEYYVPGAGQEAWVMALHCLAPAAMAFGVHVVGNIGAHRLQWKWTLVAAYVVFVVFSFNTQDHLFYMTSLTLFGANWKGKSWRVQPTPRRSLCSRLLLLYVVVFIYLAMWSFVMWNNTTITTKDGDTVKLKDAVYHFFNSPAWREMRDTLNQLWEYWRLHGTSRLWEEFISTLDPQGETNAFKTLLLSADATQKQITTQCRRLGAKYHPDRPKGDHAKFIEIQEACNVLLELRQKRQRASSASSDRQTSERSDL